jgi:serine/threonine protein kinase
MDLTGALVDGKYRIESMLGRGGMGAVYRAVHSGTDRTVAVKVIAGELASDPEYVERFRREARACGRLRHRGIVDVTDFGVATHQGRSLPYLVMEFLDGGTLADALREQPRPSLPWVIDILEQVCAAVEEAHSQGILHRDLKPENVWLEPDRRGGVLVKVLDFGLAKFDAGEPEMSAPAQRAAPRSPSPAVDDMSATFMSATMAPAIASSVDATMASGGSASTTGVAGTPAYMSPEQSRGEVATARSDVYSIGVMAYRMITGQLPFEGSLEEVLTKKRDSEPPPVLSIRPDVHADAANLVGLALSKDPAKRPASAGVFGNMLAAQLEPAGAFFTRAIVLLIARLSMFAKIGLLASAPMFVLSLLAAIYQLAALAGMWPWLTGRPAVVVMAAVFLASMVSQVFFGVMPLFVLHATAAPSKPIDVVALLRENRRRLRLYMAGIMPFTLGTLGVLLMIGVIVIIMRFAEAWIRQLPRAVRAVIVILSMSAPFAVAYAALRKRGLGLRETGMFGSVLIVEGLPVAAAAKRSAELMVESGGLRNAVQKWYMRVVLVTSLIIGASLGAGGAIGRAAGTFVLLTPLLVVALTIFLTVNAVINALMYTSARRSKGESLETIYADLIKNQGAQT